MPSKTSAIKRADYAGLRRGYCKNSECPVRDVFYALKDDPNPDTPAVCPRCHEPLTLFHWREDSARGSGPR
jgi:hypothetical protein